MTTISVCIGTYGSPYWRQLAATRAIVSVQNQTTPAHEILHHHAESLQDARNGAAAAATGEWLCFCDADDELDERYLEAMTTVAADLDGPALIQPATLGVYDGGRTDAHPVMIPAKPLLDGNFMVIGTLIRRDQFERLGGFDDWPVYEDWDLWIRAWRDGAQLCASSAAIYRVHVNVTGRNSADRDTQLRVYGQIRRRHLTGAR
jgi:glycosyltransferase involved in cell wall biosynthesis